MRVASWFIASGAGLFVAGACSEPSAPLPRAPAPATSGPESPAATASSSAPAPPPVSTRAPLSGAGAIVLLRGDAGASDPGKAPKEAPVDPVVERAVTSVRSRLADCYRRDGGTKLDPARVVFDVAVGNDGAVTGELALLENRGLRPRALACTISVLRTARFFPVPAAKRTAKLRVPVSFAFNVYDGVTVGTSFDPGY